MVPLVSVLMVAYNAADFLIPAVQSVLAQSLNDLELVLVDNASSDGSVDRLKSACADPRLRILRQDRNLLHPGGLLAGLPHCRGELVAIMDADDLSLPHRLARQVDALKADSSIGVIGCAAATIDGRGAVTGHEFALLDRSEIRTYLQFDMPFNFPTVLARRRVFESFPFRIETAPTHDLDWLMRVAESHDLSCLRENLFHYRRHESSTTARDPARLFANASAVRLAHARRRAGLAENLNDLLAERDKLMAGKPSPAGVFLHFAQLALNDGLWMQAAWHSRKAGVFGQRWQGFKLLATTLAQANRHSYPRRRELLRLAFLGTVLGYRLHPLMRRANEK